MIIRLRNRFGRHHQEQKGMVLVLMLCFLALGGLVISNSLNYVTTNLVTVETYRREMYELASADAGLSKAIFDLTRAEFPISPGDTVNITQFTLNTKVVDISIYNTYESGNRTFMIISTASTDNRSSTTVKSYVEVEISFFYGKSWDDRASKFVLNPGENYTGNLHMLAGNGIDCGGNMTGNIYGEVGNFGFHDGAIVKGDIYLMEGNIKISSGAKIYGKICLDKGNITLDDEGTLIQGEIHTFGTVKIQTNSAVVGDIDSTNLLISGGGTHNGTWTYVDDTTYRCPMLEGEVTTLSYEIE